MKILEQREIENGWEFKVEVDGSEFEVRVDKEYWQTLTGGNEDVSSLVRRSFEFLLEREPKESILKKFNLRDIKRYFPEYPEKIK